MIIPALDEAKKYAQHYSIFPFALEIFSDVKTPIEVLRNIQQQSEDWYILESVNSGAMWGRYTFLGYQPVLSMHGSGNRITIQTGAKKETVEGNPVDAVRRMIEQYKSPRIDDLPPFTGGFVGYFAYDFVQQCIPGLRLHSKGDVDDKDFHLMLMDKVIVFDHYKQKIFIIVNVSTDDIENSYINGVTVLKDMEAMILQAASSRAEKKASCGEFVPAFSEEEFADKIKRIKHHIVEGDVFQTVLSNRFTAPFQGSLMNTYRRLRTSNPSPYMVYMKLGEIEIACASPETLVSLQNGKISSFPLAGTCPRGATREKDEELIAALLEDKKELAEHDMLVDLARNDIGKVSRFGSVEVSKYRQIKQFSHVSHIASHVTGELREDLDALDVIAATIPAGTLSGAPKKRACELIDELEGMRRGAYGGALGYIDFAGNMDMCIGIRMAVLKNGRVAVQSGAGIVADSVPEKEYRETINKAKAVMNALKENGEG